MLDGWADWEIRVEIPQTRCFIVRCTCEEAVVLEQGERTDTPCMTLENGNLLPCGGVEYPNRGI